MASEHPTLLELSNRETRPHHEKPAMWIVANIHATELTGSSACLHLIDRLLRSYGTDERVTRVMDTGCFYIVPRSTPTGPSSPWPSGPGTCGRQSARGLGPTSRTD